MLQDEGLAGQRPQSVFGGGRVGGTGCGVFTERPAVACGWQQHSVALEWAARVAAAAAQAARAVGSGLHGRRSSAEPT